MAQMALQMGANKAVSQHGTCHRIPAPVMAALVSGCEDQGYINKAERLRTSWKQGHGEAQHVRASTRIPGATLDFHTCRGSRQPSPQGDTPPITIHPSLHPTQHPLQQCTSRDTYPTTHGEQISPRLPPPCRRRPNVTARDTKTPAWLDQHRSPFLPQHASTSTPTPSLTHPARLAHHNTTPITKTSQECPRGAYRHIPSPRHQDGNPNILPSKQEAKNLLYHRYVDTRVG